MDCEAKESNAQAYWDEFYRSFTYSKPSPFSEDVCSKIDPASLVLDIGCGNGRDSFYFASMGHDVVGIDISNSAVDLNNRIAQQAQTENCSFRQQDVSQVEPFSNLLLRTIETSPRHNSVIVYSRFFIHAIPEASQISMFNALKNLGRVIPITCFFEFRTLEDANREKTFKEHYRRFISLTEFVASLEQHTQMTVIEQREGPGMARFGDEDPWIGRVTSRTKD